MNRYDEIVGEIAEIRTALTPITSEMDKLAEHETLTEGQEDRFARLVTRAGQLTERRDALEAERRDLDSQVFATRQQKQDDIREGIASGRYGTTPGVDTSFSEGPTLHRSTRVSNPWAKDVETYNGTELRTAAITALERSENAGRFTFEMDEAARERIVVAAERDDDGDEVSRWAVVASDPCYASAFTKLLQDPDGAHRSWSDAETQAYTRARRYAQRAAMSEQSTHGSELVPVFLDPAIRLTNAGVNDQIRNVAHVVSTSTQVWNGVNSAGVSAEWTSEAQEMTDASPTFTSPSITSFKADAYVQASWEMLGDTTIGAQLGLLFSDAKARLEDAAWATGSGSGQPTGFVTTLSATTASRVAATTNASFGAVDLFSVAQQLPARYQNAATWAFNPTVGIEIRKFALSSGNVSSAFWADLGASEPPTLLGRPIANSTGMMTSTLSASTASNDNLLVYGDFSNYIVTDRVGAFVMPVPVVLGSNRRPTGESGWVYWWRTGAKLVNPDAMRMLVV